MADSTSEPAAAAIVDGAAALFQPSTVTDEHDTGLDAVASMQLSESKGAAAPVEQQDMELVEEQQQQQHRPARMGSAPAELNSSSLVHMHEDVVLPAIPANIKSLESAASAPPPPGQPLEETAATTTTAESTSQQRRRVTRASTANTKDKQRKAVSDSGVKDEDDDMALLPPTTTLLFTNSPPSDITIYQAPPLPVTLQTLIEVPEFRTLNEGELPMGRLRIQPNSGQQTDFSDEFYLKRHAAGELLERKGRKQERDRLVTERNRIKHQVEQLRLELASVSFYANASPIKPSAASASSSSTVSAVANSAAAASNGPSTSTQTNGRSSTPSAGSERLKESERNKRRQLQEAEDILRRYDELLQPREPYIPFSANGPSRNTAGAPRTWLTGGKGIPPPPDGITPSDFLNGPRGVAGPSEQQQQQQQKNMQGKGSAIVAQRRLGYAAESGSPATGASGTAAGRVTRSRSSSPAVNASPLPLARASPAAAGPSTSDSLHRFVPIMPRPATAASSSYSPGQNWAAQISPKAGPSSLKLKIRPPSARTGDVGGVFYQPPATLNYAVDSYNSNQHEEPLAARRRTRALQPIDVSLTREDNFSSGQHGYSNGLLKRTSTGGAVVPGTAGWQALGTGQIRPRKRRRRRRRDEDSEDDDGAKEALEEMEASLEFMDGQPDESLYMQAMQSSFAQAYDHTQPLGTPDDPEDADSETPKTAAFSKAANVNGNRRAANLKKGPKKVSAVARRTKNEDASYTPKTAEMRSVLQLEDITDFSDAGGLGSLPPALPVLPSIHIDRASSASLSTDEPIRRAPRQATSARGSTPALGGSGLNRRRVPRRMFHRPDHVKGADTLQVQEKTTFLSPGGRRGSPLPGARSSGEKANVSAPSSHLTAIEKAALTFESEGDLSSLPSDTDDGGHASEFHDSETRFRSEQSTWNLEHADTVAPAFLHAKGAATQGHVMPHASVLPQDEEGAVDTPLANLLDASANSRSTRSRASRNASTTPEPTASQTQISVGGLRTRKRPRLEDYPVNDLNEVTEQQMGTLRQAYQHVAARKKECMGTNFLEMPIGDWQVYTPESDIRYT